jgi:hypothetical protein
MTKSQSPGSRSFFNQLIRPPLAGWGKPLPLLDKRLVDDRAEVVAVTSVSGCENGIGNVADLHWLAAGTEYVVEGIGQTHFVARAPAESVALVVGADEPGDFVIDRVQFLLQFLALLG